MVDNEVIDWWTCLDCGKKWPAYRTTNKPSRMETRCRGCGSGNIEMRTWTSDKSTWTRPDVVKRQKTTTVLSRAKKIGGGSRRLKF